MKVKATRLGYYGNIRIQEGQAFRLKSEKHFSAKWMKKLNKNAHVAPIVQEQAPVESVLIDESEEEQVEADSNSEVI
jgi:hypothetical protein